jgi:hypothetical protein
MMLWFVRFLISAFVVILLASSAWMDATPIGFLEGHLRIISSREVELADETTSKMTAENYVDYPLVILSRDKKTEAAHVTADEHGNYRIALPPEAALPFGRLWYGESNAISNAISYAQFYSRSHDAVIRVKVK